MRQGGFVGGKQLPNVKFNKDLESHQYTTTSVLRHENVIEELFLPYLCKPLHVSFDHSLVLRKKSGRKQPDNLKDIQH